VEKYFYKSGKIIMLLKFHTISKIFLNFFTTNAMLTLQKLVNVAKQKIINAKKIFFNKILKKTFFNKK